MSTITPRKHHLGTADDVVLEIEVAADVTTFTWLILDDRDYPLAGGVMNRPKESSQKYSITVSPEHFETVLGRLGSFRPGDYHVHLYDGEPPQDDASRSTWYKGARLAEDAFSISDTSHGDPTPVTLMRESADQPQEPGAHATFNAFLDSLQPEERHSYRTLRRAARNFVNDARPVTQFDELLPEGYLRGRINQFPGVPQGAALPRFELIWNYWLEEGMLVQTLNVILARFQNRRLPGRDPLGRFDVTPLLPLRGLLWGFAEDEMHRLTVRRRAAEYEYEYGFSLIGRAVPSARTVVERRDGFLTSFHQVLFLAHRLFKEQDDLTVQPDAFPLYRALRDCHIVLSQGSHNQYGEMAIAARIEFLVMQTILAEPQMREFLGGRPMTPYPEEWMDRVDTMKSIQGWTETSIMHFNDLAVIGEQLVLTIRLGNWAGPNVGRVEAQNWATAFRNGIQQYAAAYRTATGVDLAEEPNSEMPSTLLARRLSGARVRA